MTAAVDLDWCTHWPVVVVQACLLGALQVIHHFVEILDRYFGNVCELDLIFNFHKVGRTSSARKHPAGPLSQGTTTTMFCCALQIWTGALQSILYACVTLD